MNVGQPVAGGGGATYCFSLLKERERDLDVGDLHSTITFTITIANTITVEEVFPQCLSSNVI